MSATPRTRSATLAVVFAIVALGPVIALRGFTVDDALITARYAENLTAGAGYRLSAGGPVTDGVTPLGFALLLAPFAGSGALGALRAAKWIGAVAWVVGAAVMGLAVAQPAPGGARAGPSEMEQPPRRDPPGLWLVPLALIASSAPLGAWAGAGMETGLVAGLGALAAALPLLGRPLGAAVCAGLCAGLRPELLPWGATVGLGLSLIDRRAPTASLRRFTPILISLTPFLCVAVIRFIVFRRVAPLSVYAKAPDASLGVMYAAACALLAGPVAIAAPLALRRGSPLAKVLALSVLVHLGAIALAGGDWMPLSRLMVPVLPSLCMAALLAAREASKAATAARLALAVAGQVFVMSHIGPTAARVGEDRLRLIDELGPALKDARVVASLDIGWVGAATGATLVDLAGVTDPAIAALPGGHTTKQIPMGLLESREVDTLVLLLAPGERAAEPWSQSRFARGVEAWVATTPGVGEAFRPVAEGSMPHLRYLVLRRAEAPGP